MDCLLILDVVNGFEHFVHHVFVQLRVFRHFEQKFMADTLNKFLEILTGLALAAQTQTDFTEVSFNQKCVEEYFELVCSEFNYVRDVRLRLDIV